MAQGRTTLVYRSRRLRLTGRVPVVGRSARLNVTSHLAPSPLPATATANHIATVLNTSRLPLCYISLTVTLDYINQDWRHNISLNYKFLSTRLNFQRTVGQS